MRIIVKLEDSQLQLYRRRKKLRMKVVLFEPHFFFTLNEMFVRDMCFCNVFWYDKCWNGAWKFHHTSVCCVWFWLVCLLCVLFL